MACVACSGNGVGQLCARLRIPFRCLCRAGRVDDEPPHVWAANQVVGFFVLSFPWDSQAVGHGVAILAATLAGFGMARFAAAKMGSNPFVRSIAALVWAFVVYEVLLRAYAQFGGGAENFSTQIVGEVALNDTLWFAGLMAVRFALSQLTGEKALPATA
jgi:hypothetical protein